MCCLTYDQIKNPSPTCTPALPLRQQCQDHLAESLVLSTLALMASVMDVLDHFKSLLIGVLERRAEPRTTDGILLGSHKCHKVGAALSLVYC